MNWDKYITKNFKLCTKEEFDAAYKKLIKMYPKIVAFHDQIRKAL